MNIYIANRWEVAKAVCWVFPPPEKEPQKGKYKNPKVQKSKRCEIVKFKNRIIQKSKSSNMQNT